MKKQFIALFAIILAVSFITCESDLPEEYTDVEYLVEGGELRAVTVYLDGATVPVTKAQRAITTDLAKMAYDYFEVIFIGPTSAKIARAAWELGQPAGISGVDRGTTGVGVNYKWTGTITPGTGYAGPNNTGVAVMFTGIKSGKTLLGVGQIEDVNNKTKPNATDGHAASAVTVVNGDSTSVTFYIEAIKTGLLVDGEKAGFAYNMVGTTYTKGTDNDYGIGTSSFTLGTAAGASTWAAADASTRITLGGVDYPIYRLPTREEFGTAATAWDTTASYEFKGVVEAYGSFEHMGPAAIRLAADISDSIVQKRIARYQDNGRYYQTKAALNSDTILVVTNAVTTTVNAADTPFVPKIDLKFTSRGSGQFAFFIEIPVYMVDNVKAATNGSLTAETWKIRTGIGAELYSLDSGKSAGGCVLMSVGQSAGDDWLDIEWEWVK